MSELLRTSVRDGQNSLMMREWKLYEARDTYVNVLSHWLYFMHVVQCPDIHPEILIV